MVLFAGSYEATNSTIRSTAHNILANANGMAWTIWDSKTLDNLPKGWESMYMPGSANSFTINMQAEVDREVELGAIRKFDTIEAMIEGCGFDPDCFKATLERYNELCEKGEDVDCYKDAVFLVPIKTSGASLPARLTMGISSVHSEDLSHR